MATSDWFYSSAEEWNALAERLKLTPCPHCKAVGMLIRHGYLVRLRRDAARNAKPSAPGGSFAATAMQRRGCGRTFSVWLADKIRRLSLTTGALWRFLQRAVAGSIAAAIRAADGHLSDRTWQRIWKRFDLRPKQNPHGTVGTLPAARPAGKSLTPARRRPKSSPISKPPSPTPTVRSPPSNMRCGPSSCKTAAALDPSATLTRLFQRTDFPSRLPSRRDRPCRS